MLGTVQIPYIQQFLYVIINNLFNWDEKKEKVLPGKKNEDRMCALDYMKSSKIPNLVISLTYGEKNMKFLRMCKFSVMPEIFQ